MGDVGGKWWQLELQDVKNSSQNVTINKLTPSFFTGRMPFLSPNQQCQSTEGKSQKIQLVYAFYNTD